MQDSCEEKFLKNTSYWEKDPSKNGSFVPPIEMGNTLCPGLCNGHGKCEKGKCICHLGYIGADCAVDKMKGPTVTSIPGNGTCDVRKRKDCHKTRIIGKDFIDSSTLTCRAVKVTLNRSELVLKITKYDKRKFNLLIISIAMIPLRIHYLRKIPIL